MKYIHLALILVAVYFTEYQDFALGAIATINILFATLFYWLSFSLLAGLSVSEVNPEIEVSDALASRLIHITGTIVLLMAGDVYTYIALITAPWVIVNTFTDFFAMLVKWQILQIHDKE